MVTRWHGDSARTHDLRSNGRTRLNDFAALPEELLWNITSLVTFHAQYLVKLQTLPEAFFRRQGQLQDIQVTGSISMDTKERLPDRLFEGLTSLRILYLEQGGKHNLPNLDDLTVCVCTTQDHFVLGLLLLGIALPNRGFHDDIEIVSGRVFLSSTAGKL